MQSKHHVCFLLQLTDTTTPGISTGSSHSSQAAKAQATGNTDTLSTESNALKDTVDGYKTADMRWLWVLLALLIAADARLIGAPSRKP